MSGDYQLVQLASGVKTLFSKSYGEKMHPGLGPLAEADLLYVRQLKIRERLKNHSGEFVIWDIGLGAAANAIATLRATKETFGDLRIVSFDNTNEPLKFALKNSGELDYFSGHENQVEELLKNNFVEFQNGNSKVIWEFQPGDFPAWLAVYSGTGFQPVHLAQKLDRQDACPTPHAIFYDAFSPAKNPAMWTLPVFENLFAALDSQRPCALATYSRSTLIRATLLLAGFFVGVGRATGWKEETTVAANDLSLLAKPLNSRWLERTLRSHSAEPLREAVYSRAELSPETAERLRQHPQFARV